jgi:transposase
LTYWHNQAHKLETYPKDGRINIDNNRAVRAVKPFVIGRKNWLFSNTSHGANASAVFYSFVETTKANGLLVVAICKPA